MHLICYLPVKRPKKSLHLCSKAASHPITSSMLESCVAPDCVISARKLRRTRLRAPSRGNSPSRRSHPITSSMSNAPTFSPSNQSPDSCCSLRLGSPATISLAIVHRVKAGEERGVYTFSSYPEGSLHFLVISTVVVRIVSYLIVSSRGAE